ncbi:DnaB-like helicase C-terminal domain-containing protein [Psychrobacillus sp. MER TA 171]|uniref:DnaB-like helicase C-terminal domain-containing protein n=1 Tax=Psychrobacillus sp. MER TA 171 TaxID=2939577 RepID=UPI00203AD6AA|nr:DnaB-like helicase C-terminal domain-containing protein [Psychrobacillus sp. MER TA 171]MCM3359226.1 DnaB-like helicase C-terminal domain-containing protein [Psychrobacillus sp. MER TA 171]
MDEIKELKNKYSLQNILLEKFDKTNFGGHSLTGIPTGFSMLDRLLNGLQHGDLIIISGLSSMGKTSFSLNICANVASKTNTCVSYFSLATDKNKVINRLLASESNLDLNKIQSNRFDSDEWRKLTHAIGTLQQSNLFIFDNINTCVSDIEQKVNELKDKTPNMQQLIVIDYLSLLDTDDLQNRYEQTSFIVKQLKKLSRKLDCPIVLVANLSRNYTRRLEKSFQNQKTPRLSDLRDSGTIEEDSDVVIFLSKNTDIKQDAENFSKLIDIVVAKNTDIKQVAENSSELIDVVVAKNRNGHIGTIQLMYLKEYSKFLNLDPNDLNSLLSN